MLFIVSNMHDADLGSGQVSVTFLDAEHLYSRSRLYIYVRHWQKCSHLQVDLAFLYILANY